MKERRSAVPSFFTIGALICLLNAKRGDIAPDNGGGTSIGLSILRPSLGWTSSPCDIVAFLKWLTTINRPVRTNGHSSLEEITIPSSLEGNQIAASSSFFQAEGIVLLFMNHSVSLSFLSEAEKKRLSCPLLS